MEKTALFRNWTTEDFEGWWNGKRKIFKPGSEMLMEAERAKVYAKHLTNRELQRKDINGNLIIKNGETFTSPKKPEQVPQFMELFNKAYIPDEEEVDVDDVQSKILTKNKEIEKKSKESKEGTMTIEAVDDDEESFIGKPKE